MTATERGSGWQNLLRWDSKLNVVREKRSRVVWKWQWGAKENFFFLGPGVLILRRNDCYILRKIKEWTFLCKEVSVQERGQAYKGFADWPKSAVEGFQELNRVEITQEKEIYRTWELLSGAKELMESSELLETDINYKVTCANHNGW